MKGVGGSLFVQSGPHWSYLPREHCLGQSDVLLGFEALGSCSGDGSYIRTIDSSEDFVFTFGFKLYLKTQDRNT